MGGGSGAVSVRRLYTIPAGSCGCGGAGWLVPTINFPIKFGVETVPSHRSQPVGIVLVPEKAGDHATTVPEGTEVVGVPHLIPAA